MVDYREILRLKSLGYTMKDIASSVHSSRNTVSEVLTLAGNLHICWPLDDDVTNASLEAIDYSARFVPRIADKDTCNPWESYHLYAH